MHLYPRFQVATRPPPTDLRARASIRSLASHPRAHELTLKDLHLESPDSESGVLSNYTKRHCSSFSVISRGDPFMSQIVINLAITALFSISLISSGITIKCLPSPSTPIFTCVVCIVPREGVEPSRARQRVLNPPCLPFHHPGIFNYNM